MLQDLYHQAKICKVLLMGLKHHEAGQLAKAEVCYRKVLELESQHVDALHLLGIVAQQSGQYEAAIQLIGAAIQRNPQAPRYHNDLGNTYCHMGQGSAAASHRQALLTDPGDVQTNHALSHPPVKGNALEEAMACYRRALELDPNYAEAHYNLGIVRWRQGHLEAASQCYRRAIELKPDCAQFHLSLAEVLRKQGDLSGAIDNCRRAIELDPDCVKAHNDLVAMLEERGDLSGAADACCRALKVKPDSAVIHSNLAGILLQQGDLAGALDSCRRALEIQPDYAQAYSNLAGILWRLGDLAGSANHCRRAIALNPNCSSAYCNLGSALSDLGDLDGALDAYRRVLMLKPDSEDAAYYMGLTHLAQGDFSLGWQAYEHRWRVRSTRRSRREFSQPLWRGEALDGARILLHAEQGFGDTLQFVRYVPLVAARGGQVILEVPPALYRLLSGMDGTIEVITRGDPFPPFSWQCPLMSLPLAFGTEMTTIPANTPYIHADPENMQAWLNRLDGGGLRVGLVWAGNPNLVRDRQRSLSLQQLAPLTKIKGVSFYALQQGPAAAETVPQGMRLIDLGSHLTDYVDTAAIISNLDLVISVDTSVAHLAGALGKAVWILLRYQPDWRWLRQREDSPWYPTARLFRQPVLGDWDTVLQRVVPELERFSQSFSTGLFSKQ